MRLWLFAAVGWCLGGCAAHDFTPPQLASKPCAQVAESRMTDARLNGYDAKDQQVVFRGAYADCMKWQARGEEPKIP